MDRTENRGSIAVIVEEGTMLSLRCKRIIELTDPLTLEAIAARESANAAANYKVKRVYIEGDSMKVNLILKRS